MPGPPVGNEFLQADLVGHARACGEGLLGDLPAILYVVVFLVLQFGVAVALQQRFFRSKMLPRIFRQFMQNFMNYSFLVCLHFNLP